MFKLTFHMLVFNMFLYIHFQLQVCYCCDGAVSKRNLKSGNNIAINQLKDYHLFKLLIVLHINQH